MNYVSPGDYSQRVTEEEEQVPRQFNKAWWDQVVLKKKNPQIIYVRKGMM